MTDQQSNRPKLSPAYRPATFDDRITVNFIGNTAIVDRLGFTSIKGPDGQDYPSVDGFQLVAAGEYLKMKGFQAIQQGELLEARRLQAEAQAGKDPLSQIIVTDKLPPEDFVGPAVLKG